MSDPQAPYRPAPRPPEPGGDACASPAAQEHVPSVAQLGLVFLGLMALLALTVVGHELPLGGIKPAVGLGIAAVKAMLVAWFFMELRAQPPMVRLFAGAGLLWLAILIALTLNDYLTRPM